jgi:hypothetical protein
MQVDLGGLGFDEGGYLLVKRALARVAPGEEIHVGGAAPELDVHLRAWCRGEGHTFRWEDGSACIVRGNAQSGRWMNSECAGGVSNIVEHAPRRWGLAARGATVEAGAPEFDFRLVDKIEVWADEAPRIYAQAVAAQWTRKPRSRGVRNSSFPSKWKMPSSKS